jgi:ABC-type nickel/cobalt efflux system permease component RcnA
MIWGIFLLICFVAGIAASVVIFAIAALLLWEWVDKGLPNNWRRNEQAGGLDEQEERFSKWD